MNIAENVDFDLETFRGQRALLQGASGSGKSNGARVMLELSYGKFQQIILDVEDEFHTLRTPEREYAIIGGDHGDAPLSTKQDASDLALTLLKVGVSTVLQIGDWTLEEKRTFIGAFIAGLMRAKPDLWHPTILMIDEAHLFAPQQGVVASSEAVTHLATAGRKRGFSAIFATQRLSLINKDVLGQCENKFLGRIEQAADRRAVADLLGFSPRSEEAVHMQAFRPGEFFVVGPALSKMPVATRLFKATTEAPKPGSTVLPTATPAAIRSALAELAKSSQTSPVVAGGTQESAAPVVRAADPAELFAAEVRGRERGYAAGIEAGWAQAFDAVREFLDNREWVKTTIETGSLKLDVDLRNLTKDVGPRIDGEIKPPPSGAGSDGMLRSSVKVVDAVVAAYPMGISLQTAAKRAGLSSRSSAFRRYLAEAAASPRIRDRGDGRFVAVEAEAGITAPAGLSAFKERLPPACSRMLEVIEAAAGNPLSLEDIAERAGVSRTSSGLGAGLKELVALDLIEKTLGGDYRLSPDFREAR